MWRVVLRKDLVAVAGGGANVACGDLVAVAGGQFDYNFGLGNGCR